MGWWLQAVVELILAAGSDWVEFRPCGFVVNDITEIPMVDEAITQPAPQLTKVLINPKMVSEIVEWKHSGSGPRCTLIIMANGQFRHVIGTFDETRKRLGK